MNTAANPDSQWLFPGGREGRPLTAGALRQRLQALGRYTTTARTARLRQLVLQVPAPVVAQGPRLLARTAEHHRDADFHALTATSSGVVGFDGSLLSSSDGQTWTTLQPPVDPFAVAASPDGSTLLITSPTGPARSTDAGQTWTSIEDAPLLQLVQWVDADTVVGTTPDGTVEISTDAGATWTTQGSTGGPPQAIGAHAGADGSTRILAVTDQGILDSVNGGVTFVPLQ